MMQYITEQGDPPVTAC